MDIKSTDRELSHHQALTTNVTGEPRSESVPLPTSIKGGRPGAVPNIKVCNLHLVCCIHVVLEKLLHLRDETKY